MNRSASHVCCLTKRKHNIPLQSIQVQWWKASVCKSLLPISTHSILDYTFKLNLDTLVFKINNNICINWFFLHFICLKSTLLLPLSLSNDYCYLYLLFLLFHQFFLGYYIHGPSSIHCFPCGFFLDSLLIKMLIFKIYM